MYTTAACWDWWAEEKLLMRIINHERARTQADSAPAIVLTPRSAAAPSEVLALVLQDQREVIALIKAHDDCGGCTDAATDGK